MAVYREGFNALDVIKSKESLSQTLVEFEKVQNEVSILSRYARKGTRVAVKNEKVNEVCILVELVDEWAVSDKRKTIKEATELYWMTFTHILSSGKKFISLRKYK